MAGKQKEIDWNKFELATKSGVSQKKIAESLFIEPDTLRSRVKEKYKEDYSVVSASLRSEGESLLEVAQFEKALDNNAPGSVQMLIWLGKIRLGQREPDTLQQMPANQQFIDQTHRIMELEHENAELKSNGNKSKTK